MAYYWAARLALGNFCVCGFGQSLVGARYHKVVFSGAWIFHYFSERAAFLRAIPPAGDF
jgi:hypothetical protein